MKPQMRLSFGLLAAVPFLMVLGNSMLFPIFPKLQSELQLSGFQTSLIVTAFSVPAGILIPIAGYLSDRYGRKPVMAPALVLFGIGALVAGISVTFLGSFAYSGLIVGRIIQGAGAAGMAQLAMALTADIFKSGERAKVMGQLEAANGLGKVVSPIAGAIAGVVLWLLPFYLFAALSIPEGILLWLLVREPKKSAENRPFSQYYSDFKGVFQSKGRSIGALLLSGTVVLFILFGTLFYLAEVLEKRYGMSELSSGFILALPVGAMAGTSLFVGNYLAKRAQYAKLVIISGTVLMAAVMVINAFFTDRWVLFGAISLMGFGGGFVLPTLTLLFTSATAKAERGMITSLYGGVRFIGVALGPPTFGWLMHKGTTPLFLAAAGLLAGTALAVSVFLDPRQILGKRATAQTRDRYVIAFAPRPRPRESQ
ncbi:MAG: MFS transporter [Thermaerobacter sp.]|nr:MFS transporter [Thermaerobacter sp.]